MAGEAARAAAAAGGDVQLVGRVGDDPAAEALLLELAASGIGHVAVLRDPARPTPLEREGAADGPDDLDPDDIPGESAPTTDAPIELDAGDVDLGLRYLTDFAVLVLVPPATPGVLRAVVDGARWSSAHLILVIDGEAPANVGLPPDAIVLEAPGGDPDGAFASVVGRLAAALEGGAAPDAAFAQVVEATGWTPAPGA